jgi:hypothetical protein
MSHYFILCNDTLQKMFAAEQINCTNMYRKLNTLRVFTRSYCTSLVQICIRRTTIGIYIMFAKGFDFLSICEWQYDIAVKASNLQSIAPIYVWMAEYVLQSSDDSAMYLLNLIMQWVISAWKVYKNKEGNKYVIDNTKTFF